MGPFSLLKFLLKLVMALVTVFVIPVVWLEGLIRFSSMVKLGIIFAKYDNMGFLACENPRKLIIDCSDISARLCPWSRQNTI